MTFTYDITEPTARDEVRGLIGDTVELKGPRPKDGATNFPDELIDSVLSKVSSSVIRTLINLHERLANEWTRSAGNEREGSVSYSGKEVAQQHRDEAKRLRKEAGIGTGFVGFLLPVIDDQYHEDATGEFGSG